VASDVSDKQRTSINDVEHDRHAQLALVWIEASECLYWDMRKGAYEKCDVYAPLNFAQQEIKYVQRKSWTKPAAVSQNRSAGQCLPGGAASDPRQGTR
jgi:hypothetical protein